MTPGSKDSSVTATSAAKTATRLANLPDPAAPDVEPLPPDFQLPAASRAQMRACGLRWHEMKLNGQAGEEIWRDFATTCLAEPLVAKSDPTTSDEPRLPDTREKK